MDAIDLILDEENELTFQLDVEGSRPGAVECRLTLENSDMSLVFKADKYVGEEVNVILPPLEHILKEGTYDMSLEVLVDDRIFVPLVLEGHFEKGVKVIASQGIVRKKKKAVATASLIDITSTRKSKNRKIPERTKVNERKISKPVKSKQHAKKPNISDEKIMEIIKMIQGRK